MNEEHIKIQDIVDALKKKWQLIACITLSATIISVVFSFFIIKPEYKASTKVFVGKESTSTGSTDVYNSNDVQMYQKLLSTYSVVIKTTDLLDDAFKSKNLDYKSSEVLSGLSVTPQTDTQVLEISFTGENKEECKEVVDAITEEFIKVAPNYYANVNVNVIEEVKLPNSPVSPNKKLNIAVAFVLGLVVGVAISLVLAMLDSTFKDKQQLEEVIGLPVIGVIPDTEKVK